MNDVNEQRKIEIEQWCAETGGLITPEQLVEKAKDPNTHCHSWFTWDDSDAAAKYRLIEARGLLRVLVTVLPERDAPVRAFVSLVEDRKLPHGGYRPVDVVMATPEQRKELVRTAYIEFRALQRRWKDLNELSGVFEALEGVEKQLDLVPPADLKQHGTGL